MPRPPKPWYRKDRKEWYVTIDGERHRLGPDAEEAKRRFHAIMATPKPEAVSPGTVGELLERFLDWVKAERAKATYDYYQSGLERVARAISHLWMDELRPYHINELIRHEPPGNRDCTVKAIKRAYNWGVREGLMPHSPLKGLQRPPAQDRDRVLTEEEFARVLECVPNEQFKDLARFVWYTGCRPQEVIRIEAGHLDRENDRIIFPPTEAKGRRKPRIIYLPPEALEIVLRNAKAHPEGLIFRNTKGRPWTHHAVGCTFGRIKKKLGERFCMYTLRHSYATHQLKHRVDPITLAHLLGHSDTSMLAKVYANVGGDAEYMREQAARK